MAWRDDLHDGSFRGAPFKVEAAEGTAGRRKVVHEYPQRDDAYVEDLGKRPRQFDIECLVIGANYMSERDALLDAVETAGTGTLVHPYLGSVEVECVDCRWRETTEEGGMARFRFTFVLAVKQPAPSAAAATDVDAVAAADGMASIATDVFADGFSIDGFPGFVENGAISTIDGFVSQARDIMSNLTGSGSSLYGVISSVERLTGSVSTLLRLPRNFASDVIGIVSGVAGLGRGPRSALKSSTRLIGFGGDEKPVIGTTPARLQEASNQAAIITLVQHAAAAEAVRSVANLNFGASDETPIEERAASYEDAVAIRDDLSGLIDDLATVAADKGDDRSWRALSALRVAMVRDVTARAGSLARVYSYRPAATEPALVLAYRLHRDAARATEIVERNRIRHPGFVAGGVDLEVLTDG